MVRSTLNLARATCPAMCSRRHQRACFTTSAAFDLARRFTASDRELHTPGGRAGSVPQAESPRHEKQDPRAAGGQAERRTLVAGGPYSLIQGNKSRKPRQHWLSGRFDGQNHPRERNPSGTTTRP